MGYRMSNIKTPKRMASFEKMTRSDLISKILNRFTDQNFIPTYQEYLALNGSMYQGDEPMDKVMAWVMTHPRQHRKYFETALYQGLDHLPHDIPELTEFFKEVETPTFISFMVFNVSLGIKHKSFPPFMGFSQAFTCIFAEGACQN